MQLTLSDNQKRFFNVFGYLHLKGWFRDDMPSISQAFEEVFANEANEITVTHDPLHGEEKRCIVHAITSKHPVLAKLKTDPRITNITRSLIGENYRAMNDDGSMFFCDSNWHPDIYGAPLSIFHIKLSFYLEPLRSNSGAIRIIPGSHHFNESYAKSLRKIFKDEARPFGMDSHEIPSVILESEPGDVVIWNFRTIHGSFFGADRRRLLSLNFSEPINE